MEKLNVENVCRAFNEARMQNVGKKLTPEQLKEILNSFGISNSLFKRLKSSSTLFQRVHRECSGRGNHSGYIFCYEPIHINWFKNFLYPQNKKESKQFKKDIPFEEECVDYLKERGYVLKRCVGFDEQSFKNDYPELYEKYLKYESI